MQQYPPQGYPPQQGYQQPAYPPQGFGFSADPGLPPMGSSSGDFPLPQYGGYPQQQQQPYPPMYPPQQGYPPQGYPQQYTQPVSQKKALLVGVSYAGTDAQVEGTIDDVDAVYAYLTRSGYAPENILVLTDRQQMHGLNRGFEELSRGDFGNAYAPPYGEAASESDSDSDSDGGGFERGAKGKKGGKKDKGGKKGKSGKKDKGGKKDKKGKGGKSGKKGKSSKPTQLVNNNTALGQYINTLAPIGIGLFNHMTGGSSGGGGGGGGGVMGALGSVLSHGGGGGGGLGTAMNLATTLLPMKNNIMTGMKWLTGNSRSGDTLFFHYSGHGKQSSSRDAGSGGNECLLPLDYHSSGMISDEELHANLISRVPEGAKLISLVDCCVAGNGMDLPYAVEARGSKPGRGELKSSRRTNTFRSSPGHTICFSSVIDGDGGGSPSYGGQYSGKLTHAFLDVMQRNPSGISYEELLFQMREVAGTTRGGFQQTPVVAFNTEVDLTQVFYV